MKIVHLIDYFQPKVGYQEYFLSFYQKRLGHDVNVITADKYFPFVNYEETYGKLLGPRKLLSGNFIEKGIKVKRLKSIEIIKGSLVILIGLNKELKKISPDIVFCHNFYSLTSFLAALFQIKTKYRLIYDTHSSAFNTRFDKYFFKIIYHCLFKTLAYPLMKTRLFKIFAIGEEEKKFICNDLNIKNGDIPIIRLGVDTNIFSYNYKLRAKTRKSLDINDKELLILFSGKVTENKKVHLIFEALKEIKNHNIKLLIIGGGKKDYIESLKMILPENKIIWRDFLENMELPSFYNASDLGIWPADPSITMLEAMSCGVPLILPDNDPETAYLDKSKGILRFKKENIQSLVKKIKYIEKNDNIRMEMSKNSSNYIKNNLSWEIIAKNTLKLAEVD